MVKHKAHLVVKGYSQIPRLDYGETYSSVSSLTALRALLTVSVALKLQIWHFDIQTAFIYGKCEETLFMERPDGLHDGTRRVHRSDKSL